MHPTGDLEALLMELVDHRMRGREFGRIELKIPIGGLPLVIDLQHLEWEAVRDDLVGEIEHRFFIDRVFILRPCRPDGCTEKLQRRGVIGVADFLDHDGGGQRADR